LDVTEEAELALIKSFMPAGAGNRGRVHGEVECGYTAFERGGKQYLQLDTYGSNERAIPREGEPVNSARRSCGSRT
jgi:hypothetical protein